MANVEYRFKINRITEYKKYETIDIDYEVAWKYGKFPWQYVTQYFVFSIPTQKNVKEDEINPFHGIKPSDIPNDLIRGLIVNDIECEHLDEGISMVTEKRRRPLKRWSEIMISRDIEEVAEEDRLKAIEHIKKEWFGEDR